MANILDIFYRTVIDRTSKVQENPVLKWVADKALGGSVEYASQRFVIPANQSGDLSLPIQELDGTFLAIIYNPENKTRIGGATTSVKINGSESMLLAPRIVLSEEITSLSATNSDTSIENEIIVAKFYKNGTVNFRYN